MKQLSMFEQDKNIYQVYNKNDALDNIRKLYKMWKKGLLGGEFMPEDSNPHLPPDSEGNLIYFTLPMALNYQRNSYKLWESALKSYKDQTTKFIFSPEAVLCSDGEDLKNSLMKYGVAIQPNKHTAIWVKLCNTIVNCLDGSLQNLFERCNYCVLDILREIQVKNKKDYPYLSGNKIANYWLYVLTQYTSLPIVDKQNISVAPDTHVIQSTYRLGLIKDINASNIQEIVANVWKEVLKDTEFSPIDIHTPMWLWSRGGFIDLIDDERNS